MYKARKCFSQNFLIDKKLTNSVVISTFPKKEDLFVEIGPGLGALTKHLLDELKHLTVIEIDKKLAFNLRKRYPSQCLTILRNDVLKVNFSEFGQNIRIIGSLPYHISSPILFHLMKKINKIKDQHLILQNDFVNRMIAKPSSHSYGRLSVVLQARYKMEKIFEIPPESFYPKPRVFSALIKMVPKDRFNLLNPSVFEYLVATAFSNRRKMLRKTLAKFADYIPWEELEIIPTERAQDISVEKYIALSNVILLKRCV